MVQPALQLLISHAGAAPCVTLHCAATLPCHTWPWLCLLLYRAPCPAHGISGNTVHAGSLVATEVPYSVYSLPFIT